MASSEASATIRQVSKTGPDELGWLNYAFTTEQSPPRLARVMVNPSHKNVAATGPYSQQQMSVIDQLDIADRAMTEEERAILHPGAPDGYEVDNFDVQITGDYPGGWDNAAQHAAAFILAQTK